MKHVIMIFMLAFTVSQPLFANEPIHEPTQDEIDQATGYRLFRAEGTHICWSDKVIGNTCFVTGVNYTDCLTAHFNLKQWDCCRATPGSHSVNFVMSKCTQW